MQSILFLILCFILSSFIFLILGSEFIAILLLIVYVGAISILFLFVVMMLNLRLVELYGDFFSYLPVGGFIGLFFLVQLFIAVFYEFGFFSVDFLSESVSFQSWVFYLYEKNNITNLAIIFYNFYLDFLIIASFILFVSMLGVILLTVDYEYRPFKQSDRPWGSFSYALNSVSSWKIKF